MSKPLKSLTIICRAFLIMMFSVNVCAEETATPAVHKKVQQALDWRLPKIDCEQPKAPGTSKEVRGEDGATRTEWDVDSNTLARYERKEKRWQNCVEKYKTALAKDFDVLKSSAQYGLTQSQADTILGHMKTIQSAIFAPDGIPPETTE